MCAKWVLIAVMAFVSLPVHGHFGDRVFPIPELTDEMLAEIDFNDGLVEDWIEVVGEPVLTPFDFVLTRGGLDALISDPGQFDPADLDFRIWLGWHDGSDKMLVAGQFVDDGFKETTESLSLGAQENYDGEVDRFWFAVDGDHSGPPYLNFPEMEKLHRTSQEYEAVAVVAEGPNVILSFAYYNFDVWMARPPYALGGGRARGENPTVWVVELLLTPFDLIVWDDPDESIVSTLEAGEVIGMTVSLLDIDSPKSGGAFYSLSGTAWWEDRAADGLLLGARELAEVGSAVEVDSWGRIKASLK